ncbi:MAG: hypothetical protein V4632_06650 [Pseudomonadota bacterium]
MSFLSIGFPVISAGVFATLLVVFKPIITGMLRAALLIISPRKSLNERNMRSRLQGVLMLNRLARDMDASQPGLAAEFRYFASRD